MNDGRDAKGKFAKGNPGGPGRHKREREEQYLKALTTAVTLDKWNAIIARAVEDAISGDDGTTRNSARRWIAEYLIGKPVERVQFSRADDAADDLAGYTDEELRAIATAGGGGVAGEAGSEGGGGAAGAGAPGSD